MTNKLEYGFGKNKAKWWQIEATMVDLSQLSDAELVAHMSGTPEEQEVVQWL